MTKNEVKYRHSRSIVFHRNRSAETWREQNTPKECHELSCIDILYHFFLEKGKNVAWFQTKITAKHQSVYLSVSWYRLFSNFVPFFIRRPRNLKKKML